MRSNTRREPPAKAGLRITMQYRRGNGKVYELENAGVILDVHVSPGTPGESLTADGAVPESDHWLVEAQSSRAEGAIVVAERGATRAEALRGVGRKWSASAASSMLPVIDWSAVESVLESVRAI